MKKEVVDLTIDELKSLQSTLKMLNRKEMLQEVEKEIERRKKNGLKR
jgi:hypothetical protein